MAKFGIIVRIIEPMNRLVWIFKKDGSGIESAELGSGQKKKPLTFDKFVESYEKLDSKEKAAFKAKTDKWDKDFTGHSINSIRSADLSAADQEADPDKKFILLASQYLQRDPKNPNRFKADFHGNYLAEYKAIGWGHVFPDTVESIKVYNQVGEVICDKAVRSKDPNSGKEGYFEANGLDGKPPRYNYIFMYTGYTAEIIKTIPPEEAQAKKKLLEQKAVAIQRSSRMQDSLLGPQLPKPPGAKKTPGANIDQNLAALQQGSDDLTAPLETAELRDGRKRIVDKANSYAGSRRFDADFQQYPALNGGKLGCAWVASTILREAGYLDQTIPGVEATQAALLQKGWTISNEQPEPGDVVIWERLPGRQVIKDDGDATWVPGHKHIGIVVGPNTVVDNRAAPPPGPRTGPLYRPGRGIEAILKPPGEAGKTATAKGEKQPKGKNEKPQKKSVEVKAEKGDTTAGLKGIELIENPQFREKLNQVAESIGCSPEDLIAIFTFESAGIDPQAQNRIGATGLIQWIPPTAKSMFNMDVNQIRGMSGLQQLSLVETYFKKSGKNSNIDDLYLSVLYPYAKNKPEDYILGSEKGTAGAQKFADQNPFAGRDENNRARLVRKSDVLRRIRGVRESNKYIARYQELEKPNSKLA